MLSWLQARLIVMPTWLQNRLVVMLSCCRPVLIAFLVTILLLAAAALRAARNVLAAPYFVVTDGKEATYSFTTRWRKEVCSGLVVRARVIGFLADRVVFICGCVCVYFCKYFCDKISNGSIVQST